ncbi:MAG: multinuclear nonheme iron-dependent oxidase, partial [Candidatus Binatia bacterium]
ILLDVNNVYVSSVNHGFDPVAYIDALPPGRVLQLHLAGHEAWDGMLLDSHGAPVADEVLRLHERTCLRFGPVPALLEWDRNLPDLGTAPRRTGADRSGDGGRERCLRLSDTSAS